MMKRRTHVCVAAVACLAAGTASAQSTVRLFGVMDAAVSYYQTDSKDPSGVQPNLRQSQWALSTGNLMGSRFGFSGTEEVEPWGFVPPPAPDACAYRVSNPDPIAAARFAADRTF